MLKLAQMTHLNQVIDIDGIAVKALEGFQGFADRQKRQQGSRLKLNADLIFERSPSGLVFINNFTGGGRDNILYDFDGCRFAGTIRSQKAETNPLLDAETGTVYCVDGLYFLTRFFTSSKAAISTLVRLGRIVHFVAKILLGYFPYLQMIEYSIPACPGWVACLNSAKWVWVKAV